MKKIILSLLCILGLSLPLIASSPTRGLGSAFSLLVNDPLEDSKTFPDRLTRLQERSVELGLHNDKYSLSLLPSLGKLVCRFTTDYEAKVINTETSESFQNHKTRIQYRSNDFTAAAGFKIGSVPFGLKFGLAGYENKYTSSLMTNLYSNANHEKISTNNSESAEYHFAISHNLGKNRNTSLALFWLHHDRDSNYRDLATYDSSFNKIDSNQDNITNSYTLNLITDFGKNKHNRFYSRITYSEYDEDVQYSRCSRDSSFWGGNSSIADYQQYENSNKKRNSLQVEAGFCRKIPAGKLNFYLGAKPKFSYSSYEAVTSKEYDYEIQMNDSLYVVSDSTEVEYSYNTTSAFINLPLGMSWQPATWVKIYAAVTTSFSHKNLMGDDLPDWDFAGISSKQSQQLSLEFFPLKNLEAGIYKITDLEQYKYWKLNLTYKF